MTFMKKFFALMLAVLMLAACFTACSSSDDAATTTAGVTTGPNGEQPSVDLSGTYEINMWVSEVDGVAEQFKTQIDAFEAAHPGIIINAKVEGVPEGEAASKVISDIATAPDVYCFAQDQLARLVQAQAIAAPSATVQNRLKAANDTISISAASVGGKMYAYPLTSDNGYYLYYDTSIISAEEADSLEAIIAACEKNGKTFRYALENGWYTASFFFATGCHSNWTTDTEGKFNAVDDNFDSDAGFIAMKGMQKLASSTCYDSDNNTFTNAGAIVTGIWAANDAEAHFGANLGATDLPSFKVDGKDYHLGSFSGNKLMGVKPQSDAKRGLVLSLLAEYLTGKECQIQRYQLKQWGPSNLEAQKNDSVKANKSLAALALQSAHAVPQGNIHGGWWDTVKVLGADARTATTDAALRDALKTYKTAVDGFLTMSDEARAAWSVIGSLCDSAWGTDFPMTKVSEGTYQSEALDFKVGDEFKVRQGASWDVNFGVDGFNGANIVVETAGKYKVQLVWDGAKTGTVTLIPA
jgi:arabinogalactan oligomer/maltooligosaccharide transport system substrate-binding protein